MTGEQGTPLSLGPACSSGSVSSTGGYQPGPRGLAPHGLGHPVGGYGQPRPQIDPNIQQWFSAVDADRSGHICAGELQRALVNGNYSHFSEEACRMMIELYDVNNSGSIDIYEFQQLFNAINRWKGTFQSFDTDRSGSIDHSEMTRALQQMGYTFSPMFVEKLVTKYDMRTRKISLDNFIVVNNQMRRLTDGFRKRDSSRQGQATMHYEDFMGLAMGILH